MQLSECSEFDCALQRYEWADARSRMLTHGEALYFVIICGYNFFLGSRSWQNESVLLRSAVHFSVIIVPRNTLICVHCSYFIVCLACSQWRKKETVSVCSTVLCDLLRHYYFLRSNVCALLKRSVFICYLSICCRCCCCCCCSAGCRCIFYIWFFSLF